MFMISLFLLNCMFKEMLSSDGVSTLVTSRVNFIMAVESAHGQMDQYMRVIGLTER
jgi:hypothetical protein